MTEQRKKEVAALTETIRDLLKPMTPEERLVVFSDVGDGYCSTCGYERPDAQPCHTCNDE